MTITGMSLPGRGSRATPKQVAKTKRRAMIVQRSYALAAAKAAIAGPRAEAGDGWGTLALASVLLPPSCSRLEAM